MNVMWGFKTNLDSLMHNTIGLTLIEQGVVPSLLFQGDIHMKSKWGDPFFLRNYTKARNLQESKIFEMDRNEDYVGSGRARG